MRNGNPLKSFHSGVPIHEIESAIPWHTTRDDFATLIPEALVTSQNQHWVSLKCTILTVHDEYSFSFIPHPDPVFREIQVYDQTPDSMTARFSLFVQVIKDLFGPPTMEYGQHVRWHDTILVLDLSIRNVRNTPGGPEFPCFSFSFQNSTRYPSHWNNQTFRRPGLEQMG